MEKDIRTHGDYLSQLRDDVSGMEHRLHKVETQMSSSMVSTGPPEQDLKRTSLIMGGWPEEIQREVLLADIWELLHRVGLDDRFSDIFTTGPRRGFAIGNVTFSDNVGPGDVKRQLIEMTVQIRKAQVRSDKMTVGKYLWANLSKPKAERDRGAHASKLKRVVLEITGGSDPGIELEHSAGSAWLPCGLYGSATRLQPGGTKTLPGRSQGTWIDIGRVASAFGMAEADVEAKWREVTE